MDVAGSCARGVDLNVTVQGYRPVEGDVAVGGEHIGGGVHRARGVGAEGHRTARDYITGSVDGGRAG